MRYPPVLLLTALSSLLVACAGSEPPPREPSPPRGDPPGPEAPPAADPPWEEPPKLAGANLSMGSLEVDGVRLERISCKVDGGLGLVGALVLAAGFSKRRSELDACSPGGLARTSVTWTAAGGTIARITAGGSDARINRCVEKALLGAPAPLPATCVATLVHGRFTPPR